MGTDNNALVKQAMKTEHNALIQIDNRLEIDIQKPQSEIALIVKQAAKLVKILVTAYPNSDKFPNDEAVENTVILWANYFADDDWRVVALALQKHIATSKWVPSIAEIRELTIEITRPDLVPPDEAWAMVNNWLHSTSEYGGEDVHKVFPTIIADTIVACGGKSALWALLRQQFGYSGKAGLDKLTFMQLYEPRYKRDIQRAMTPGRVLSDIGTVQQYLDNAEYRKLENSRTYISDKVQEKREFYESINNRHERRLLELAEKRYENGGYNDD